MRHSKRRKYEKQVINMYCKNFTHQEIAKIIGVTEKTIRTWLIDFRKLESETKEKIKTLDKRLELMLENSDTPSEEIKNITISITALEGRLNK